MRSFVSRQGSSSQDDTHSLLSVFFCHSERSEESQPLVILRSVSDEESQKMQGILPCIFVFLLVKRNMLMLL